MSELAQLLPGPFNISFRLDYDALWQSNEWWIHKYNMTCLICFFYRFAEEIMGDSGQELQSKNDRRWNSLTMHTWSVFVSVWLL